MAVWVDPEASKGVCIADSVEDVAAVEALGVRELESEMTLTGDSIDVVGGNKVVDSSSLKGFNPPFRIAPRRSSAGHPFFWHAFDHTASHKGGRNRGTRPVSRASIATLVRRFSVLQISQRSRPKVLIRAPIGVARIAIAAAYELRAGFQATCHVPPLGQSPLSTSLEDMRDIVASTKTVATAIEVRNLEYRYEKRTRRRGKQAK